MKLGDELEPSKGFRRLPKRETGTQVQQEILFSRVLACIKTRCGVRTVECGIHTQLKSFGGFLGAFSRNLVQSSASAPEVLQGGARRKQRQSELDGTARRCAEVTLTCNGNCPKLDFLHRGRERQRNPFPG